MEKLAVNFFDQVPLKNCLDVFESRPMKNSKMRLAYPSTLRSYCATFLRAILGYF